MLRSRHLLLSPLTGNESKQVHPVSGVSEFYNLTREQVICKSSHQVNVGKDRSCTWILPVDLLNEAELTKYNISCVTRSIVNLSKL